LRVIAKLSLTTRLTLLFATGSSVVLLALGWLIGASIERHFEDLDRDALSAKVMLAHHAIARVQTAADLEHLPSQISDAVVGHHDLMIRILGPGGKVLLASSDVPFPQDWEKQITRNPEPELFEWTQGEHRYRGLATSIPTSINGWPPLMVAVALDIGHHQAFMTSFMQTLWLFVAGAALATGLLGRFAASRGLAPLRAMRERAALVTAQRLDQRLPVDAVPAELADLATTLNDMLARLEEAFRRLSDFSSDIAHELRTPVSNLMTQTQVSLARTRDAASYRGILESNAEEFERLARMISDMLFLAKAENGLALVDCEQVDLAREVRDLFEFYEALADEKGVRLELVGACNVMGDRLMLRRALSNLLSNALRYTPRGGSVVVSMEAQDGQTVLSVENSGETIAQQHLPRLFERFYRADPSRQQATGEGTGLGLAITQAIVRAHQGQVSVISEAGRTRFCIQLPRIEPMNATPV
jgi:two-component system heavy metal sensor histidine kinase CusS